MKSIDEVLRKKEGEMAQIQKEIEALRLAQKLLNEDETPRVAPTAAKSAVPVAPAAWDAAPKQFP